MLNPPGKVILASDEGLDTVFERLVASELNSLKAVSRPTFVASFFDQISRGKEISLVHYSTIEDPGETIATYDCSALPADVISTDIPRILRAVEVFETSPKS